MLLLLVIWIGRIPAPAPVSHAAQRARQPGDACRDDGNPELLFSGLHCQVLALLWALAWQQPRPRLALAGMMPEQGKEKDTHAK